MTATVNADEHEQRRLADELLAPDPGPPPCDISRWYGDVTTQRALEVAERRHAADLRRRYVASREWADYSVDDLRLPMTQRQATATAVTLFVALVVTLAGVAVGSPAVTFTPLLVSVPVTGLVVRDVYRRADLWLRER